MLEGIVKRNNPIRVLRDNVVYLKRLESLRRFKDDVAKCVPARGIGVKSYNDVGLLRSN